jgi:uncharacterized membrane protein YphA (DoxX/SURF4 family)
MSRSISNSLAFHVTLLLNRLAIGLIFLLAGAHKIGMGVRTFYEQGFLALKPAWLPTLLAAPYGYALPFLEVAVGTLLIIGAFGRVVAGVATLMLISFTIALYAAGKFFPESGPFHTNVVFITITLLLAATGPGPFSLDTVIRNAGRLRVGRRQ